jgi:hypothetical protein
VYLFARPDEPLALKLYGGGERDGRLLMSTQVTGRQLESGSARVNGTAGGSATLTLQPRRTGPEVAPGT